MSDDDETESARCFGCGSELIEAMDTYVVEPCPDVLGNQHAWHWQCFICHKSHGAFPNMERCEPELS